MIGGVAGGVADWLGIDPTLARIGFLLAALMSGFGVALYLVAWVALPMEGDTQSMASRVVHDWRGIALALSLVPVVVVSFVLGSALGAGWIATVVTPLCVAAGGLVLVWRNVGDDERDLVAWMTRPLARLGLTGAGSWRGLVVRLAVGAALAGGGVTLLLLQPDRALLRPLGGIALVIGGAVVAFGPWWLHVARALVDERQARALAEERADMAAQVHDSVLQTLALIQRRADQPQQVVKLARAQERELRSWLFDGRAPGGETEGDDTLAEAVHRIEREVEELHEIPVEAVVVGDCALDEELRALVAAGREATVNAAKWSGAPVVSLFAEVEPETVSLFVRDRGAGFDPAQVAADRRGLAQSIVGRVERHGGSAEVRSGPGSGTEVALRMPRHANGNGSRPK
jgi:signal transduction histidine kinase